MKKALSKFTATLATGWLVVILCRFFKSVLNGLSIDECLNTYGATIVAEFTAICVIGVVCYTATVLFKTESRN